MHFLALRGGNVGIFSLFSGVNRQSLIGKMNNWKRFDRHVERLRSSSNGSVLIPQQSTLAVVLKDFLWRKPIRLIGT
jgi:hypothetical protein